MQDPLATAVRILVDLFVRGEYETIETMTRGRRLQAFEIAQAIEGYGGRLELPPQTEYHRIDAVPVTSARQPAFHVVFPLWTEEEGRSDLSIELLLTQIDGSIYDVELLDIHVL
jgi:hypothetical protein